MSSRLSFKPIQFSFLFILLLAFPFLIKAQIKVVYKDKKADTLKLFENKKVLIDQLSQKEAQNSIQIDKIDQYTKTLAKANDSLANGLSQLKKEVDAIFKSQVVLPSVPVIPQTSQPAAKPVTPWKQTLPIQSELAPNGVPVYIASYFNLKLDSIKNANSKLNDHITILQEAVAHLKARPASLPASAPVSECSHTLIYILIGILTLGIVLLLFKNK